VLVSVPDFIPPPPRTPGFSRKSASPPFYSPFSFLTFGFFSFPHVRPSLLPNLVGSAWVPFLLPGAAFSFTFFFPFHWGPIFCNLFPRRHFLVINLRTTGVPLFFPFLLGWVPLILAPVVRAAVPPGGLSLLPVFPAFRASLPPPERLRIRSSGTVGDDVMPFGFSYLNLFPGGGFFCADFFTICSSVGLNTHDASL